ncbi:Hypothetical predicted protein [Mytilus galloprovincialis]|uniref:Uncharacterized protein n=1 Tax=Mytilus galloprovincialis TaxID=29158 RepID=A0A8B6D6H9_MYTGA|nr:Hypothetical predicted protein [Mytilus galloprovincialis]
MKLERILLAEGNPKLRRMEVDNCVSSKQFSKLHEEVRQLRKRLDLHISSVTSCGTSLKQEAQPQESSSWHVAPKKPNVKSILSMQSNTPDMCQSAASSYTSCKNTNTTIVHQRT